MTIHPADPYRNTYKNINRCKKNIQWLNDHYNDINNKKIKALIAELIQSLNFEIMRQTMKIYKIDQVWKQ